MTELSDELLVAYVDGQLARDQTRAVDKVLDQDDVVARRVEALKQAHSRFECAFEAILAGEVSELMANAPSLPPPIRRRRGNGLAKIGAITAGLGLGLFALVAGYGWPLALPERATLPQAGEVSSATRIWQDEAVRAQSLLSRDSVEVAPESQGNFDLVALQMAQVIGPAVKIPDLEAQGFKFVRGQLLRFEGEPLAQLLYLGGGTAPLALYARRGDQKARDGFAKSGAIGSVAWSDDGIAYLLAGEEDKATLLRLAEKIRHEPSTAQPASTRKLSVN
jgi:anti-sigma factor RsiW